MKKILVLLACLTLFSSACAKKAETVIMIVPNKCSLSAGEELPISLEGSNMPSSGEIVWSTTKGEINPPAGLVVIYTAPQEPGPVIITALLETTEVKYSTTLTCEVTAANTDGTISPAITAPDASNYDNTTIAITEVMATPCNGLDGGNKNEYVELYNYGSTAIDVEGWWLATGPGGEGTPDQITRWDNINPGISLGNNVIANSATIPAKSFAVIISPRYYINQGEDYMPYIFPRGTTILTLANSNYLGNDNKGLRGTDLPLSTLALYVGSNSVMDKVVSTYGTPVYGSSPGNVVDDRLDAFPYPLYNCQSMERVVAFGKDITGNWRDLDEGNPGAGNYLP